MAKILGIAFSSLLCSILLKNKQPQISFAIAIVGVALIITSVVSQIVTIKENIAGIGSVLSNTAPYIELMVKTLVIVILTQILADICRDNGESALASATEISAKIIIVAMVLPLFNSIISIVLGFAK